jgi:plasmid maintenance system antidote protein VapI
MDMPKRQRTGTMTELLREALLSAPSLNAIQKATGVRRQTLAAFMRGAQRSIHLASADRLAQYFGITCSQGPAPQREGAL